MRYIVMAVICFCIDIFADWILLPEDWDKLATVAYYVVAGIGAFLGTYGLVMTLFE